MKILVAMCTLVFALPLAAQEARLTARFSPGDAHAVQVLVDSAKGAGLPTEPLVQKALEGKSKQAGTDRILSAVRALLVALQDSRTALGTSATLDEVTAGANALRAGATSASVGALRRQRGREVTVPLSVLADLVVRGVSPTAASRAVESMVHDGVSDRDFLLLRTQVEQDIRTGATPATALDRRLAGLPAAAPPRVP